MGPERRRKWKYKCCRNACGIHDFYRNMHYNNEICYVTTCVSSSFDGVDADGAIGPVAVGKCVESAECGGAKGTHRRRGRLIRHKVGRVV